MFQVLAERHERRSVIITTNLGFGDWTQIFGDPTLTAALLDRVTHKAFTINCTWQSYRLKDTLKNRQPVNRAGRVELRSPYGLPPYHPSNATSISRGIVTILFNLGVGQYQVSAMGQFWVDIYKSCAPITKRGIKRCLRAWYWYLFHFLNCSIQNWVKVSFKRDWFASLTDQTICCQEVEGHNLKGFCID